MAAPMKSGIDPVRKKTTHLTPKELVERIEEILAHVDRTKLEALAEIEELLQEWRHS